ncbi:hypothetical protein HZA97_07695 [Candidatus Woesearchaeota archaeon]|nr:hypothetical protein [Candidatus Woesearchaeota archaeon]
MTQQDQEIAKDGMVGDIPVNPEMVKTLKINADADDIQKLMDSAAEQFNVNQLKEKYKQKLLSSNKFTGSDRSEEATDLAVQRYFDEFYVFQGPENTFSTKLARAYVNRARIGRKYGIPTLAVLALSTIVYVGSIAVNAITLRAAESGVESAVEDSYKARLNLANQIKDLNSQKNSLPDSTELTELIRNAGDNLRSTDDFFETYCDDGTASDDINQSNYKEAEQKLDSINGVLATVKGKVNTGQGLIRTEQDLVATRQSLDSLIQEIKSSNPPAVLRTKAQSAYDSGIASITNRQLQEGINYKQQLVEIKLGVKEFETLPARLEQVYSSVRIVSQDPEANSQAEDLHTKGRNYVSSVDIASLKTTIASLESLDAVLKQEYTVRIVNKSGVKSGIDRYYTDNAGKRLAGFYLIVEAVDQNGNTIARQIENTDEQSGQIHSVRMWGERVPSEVYEAVKADKMDNGRVDKTLFSEKKAGYLKEVVKFPGVSQRTGQITSW